MLSPVAGLHQALIQEPGSQSLHVALDEAAQHFIEFRRMLSVREVTGAIENIHSRIVRVARDEIE
jgi:hypothetical protein